MSLGDKLWRRKKKGATKTRPRVYFPPRPNVELKIVNINAEGGRTPLDPEDLKRMIEESRLITEREMVWGGTPVRIRNLSAKKETKTRMSFSTTWIIQSETLGRGFARINDEMASYFGILPEHYARVTFAGRSIPVRLLTSRSVRGLQVELNGADMDELGISEGVSGALKVDVGDQELIETGIPVDTPGGRSPGPHEVRKAVNQKNKLDDSPPYEVESGFGFLKRRRRS